jgi:hypothetical protein
MAVAYMQFQEKLNFNSFSHLLTQEVILYEKSHGPRLQKFQSNFKISVKSITFQPKFIFISSAPIAPSIYNTHTKIYHYSHMHLKTGSQHKTQSVLMLYVYSNNSQYNVHLVYFFLLPTPLVQQPTVGQGLLNTEDS